MCVVERRFSICSEDTAGEMGFVILGCCGGSDQKFLGDGLGILLDVPRSLKRYYIIFHIIMNMSSSLLVFFICALRTGDQIIAYMILKDIV